jgi:hypothetical protein
MWLRTFGNLINVRDATMISLQPAPASARVASAVYIDIPEYHARPRKDESEPARMDGNYPYTRYFLYQGSYDQCEEILELIFQALAEGRQDLDLRRLSPA